VIDLGILFISQDSQGKKSRIILPMTLLWTANKFSCTQGNS